jgi:divalent metal cation (Fe/Co/Zn/Cd) transporter
MSAIHKNKYGSQYITDKAYRTKISLYMALSMNTIYAAFKLIAGVYYASFWYGADAIFYVILSLAQFLMLRHMRKKGNSMEDEYKQYRFCGYLLFALNAALTGVVYQMINQGMGYEYSGLMIYVVATYAFVCLAAAITNVIEYRKLNSPVISAVKAIRLSKALVAIYALQSAMLTSFGGNESESFKNIMNGITGSAVCLFVFGLAVYMVVRGNKNLKRIRINNLET